MLSRRRHLVGILGLHVVTSQTITMPASCFLWSFTNPSDKWLCFQISAFWATLYFTLSIPTTWRCVFPLFADVAWLPHCLQVASHLNVLKIEYRSFTSCRTSRPTSIIFAKLQRLIATCQTRLNLTGLKRQLSQTQNHVSDIPLLSAF